MIKTISESKNLSTEVKNVNAESWLDQNLMKESRNEEGHHLLKVVATSLAKIWNKKDDFNYCN